MERSMEELLAEMANLRKHFEQLGVSPEKADDLAETVNQYMAAKEEIIRNRDVQFEYDARVLASQIQAATNKNIAKIAAFLREFAEHVAKNVTGHEGRIVDLVDHVPAMTEDE